MSTAQKIIAATSGVGGAGLNVEDVFQTRMYLGTGSNQTITNNIDLSGEGGLVWFKRRNGIHEHGLYDTVRGTGKRLMTDQDGAQETDNNGLNSFYSTGFRVKSADDCNGNSDTYASWTFRRAEKFFDIVTYSSAGTGNTKTVSHNLGQAPGMIFFKEINGSQEWVVWHTSQSNKFANLSYISAFTNATVVQSASSTNIVLASDRTPTNASGSPGAKTYIAYLFANNNNDGGYGPDADQDIIKCGSFTSAGSGSSLVGPNLGWEPQWVMLKNATSNQSGSWWIFDSHRGFYSAGYDSNTGKTRYLMADSANAEGNFNNNTLNLTSTGFTMPSDAFSPGQTWVYMAIRRAPTKEAESGPEVFGINAGGSTNYFSVGAITYAHVSPDDLVIVKKRDSTTPADRQWAVTDRIRGIEPWTSWTTSSTTTTPTMFTHSTNGESVSGSRAGKYPGTTGNGGGNASSTNILTTSLAPGISYWWRRSPGFFDIVSYHGDGNATQTITHNLQGIPKMIWAKRRDGLSSGTGSNWIVYYGSGLYNLFLNSTTNFTGLSAMYKVGNYASAIDSTTEFAVALQSGGNATYSLNTSGQQYVLYIFGEQTGISKIGTYSGTGSDVDVDCGFSTGARFVMIKNATAGVSGGWYVWNSTTGINAGTENYNYFNSTAAENSGGDLLDPLNAGFTVTPNGGSGTNASSNTYFFYAIA